jgi:hypothetical protein
MAGTIDLASSYEVLSVLSSERPTDCYDWAWQQAVRVTTTLVSNSGIGIAPSPGPVNRASGSLGELMYQLSAAELVALETPGSHIADLGLRETRAWVRAGPPEIRGALRDVKADPNYLPWLDWNLRGVWQEHSRRLGGLFDPTLLPEVALVLDVSERDAARLLAESSESHTIERYVAGGRDGDTFQALCDAWIVATLIRGWYHDRVAQLADRQICHHPVRSGVFPLAANLDGPTYLASEAELVFANIIIADTFERPEGERIGRWVDSVAKARVRWSELDVARTFEEEPFTSQREAEKRAFAAAERLEIGVSRNLDRFLVWSMKLFPLGLGFLIQSWEAIGVDLAAIVAGDKVIANTGRSVAARATGRTARLQKLADAGPGRIEPFISGSPPPGSG